MTSDFSPYCRASSSACFPLLLAVVLLAGCSSSRSSLAPDDVSDAELVSFVSASVKNALQNCSIEECETRFHPGSAVDTVIVDRSGKSLEIHMNDAYSQIPLRELALEETDELVRSSLGSPFVDWAVQISALDAPLASLVPNLYRRDGQDESKLPSVVTEARRLTTNLDSPWTQDALLSGRHIAIWPSHGWYYEQRLDRWEWQRARLFQTVEDLFPMSFIVPYLAPMLEHAGAHVHMPRERDVQANEVIVDFDDDTPGRNRYLEVGEEHVAWKDASTAGFAPIDILNHENPFADGSHRISVTEENPSATTSWVPDIPEGGNYAVYVSYGRTDNPTTDALYTVFHAGGSTRFSVDQSMKPGTWVYLGTFQFAEGVNPDIARVEMSNTSSDIGKAISADAVRFGGGMGSVSREGKTSGRPRFTEGARYYMQFSGMPDRLVYNVTETENDYVDDYRGRAEWVNYLRGAPLGPNKNRQEKGLNVPVDISLAFHTDAGITRSDDTIGTLMIYSSEGMEAEKVFPDGLSRFSNRDLGDIMQTSIVEDIWALYDSTWSRRDIWDRDYSEAVRPNVPGVLLELMSHQNLADMKFGLDPRFRFDVARSIYKSMVRFLAHQNGTDVIIQPLPVTHLRAQWSGDTIQLSWRGVDDPLEPSAAPDEYVVYIREDRSSFDNGRRVGNPEFILENARPGVVYSFRVGAVNGGGESMPSEEVSAGRPIDDLKTGDALIIAAFDRVSAPASIEYGSFRGFANFLDEGVADRYDLSFIGTQYDFDSDSPWLDDDSPGHGASFSTFETQILTGNTFNYPSVHGAALLASGYAFSTVTDELLEGDEEVSARAVSDDYPIVDVILGEEKTIVGPGRLTDFEAVPSSMQRYLKAVVDKGGSLLISGAHVATDLAGPEASAENREFASQVLGFTWRTDHAVQRGAAYALEYWMDGDAELQFNTDPTGSVYRVESPDALEAADDSEMLMRYSDNNMGAVIGRGGKGGAVVMGFPFETIEFAQSRNRLMKAILEYLR